MPREAGMKAVLRVLVGTLVLLCCASQTFADNLAEYRVKAGFLVNFAAFTEWPAEVGSSLNLCVYGPDPFGEDLDKFQSRSIGGRNLMVTRVVSVDMLENCQVVFISRPVIDNLQRVLDTLNGKPVLTVADSPGAMHQGVMLNMGTRQSRVTFEANLAAARGNGLSLSSKLLNLASEVRQ
jgi:YfiR/HmsC-like